MAGRLLSVYMPAKWLCPSSYALYEGSAATHPLPIYVGRDMCVLSTWMIHIFKVTLSTLVYATVNSLQDLGFNVNDRKSVFLPTQKLEYLGFILDSLLMTITLTARRKVVLLNACSKLLQNSRQKIRVVSTVIGMIIAALPRVKHGALCYRTLESEKTAALCHNGDDYNGYVTLSPLATMEIHWWHTDVYTSHHFIRAPPPDTTIYSDSDGATNSLTTVGAPWEDMDDLPHQCVRASFAAYNSNTLGSQLPGFTHMFSVAYILGDTNVVDDFLSQCFTENTEWALNTDVFLQLPNVFSNLRLTYLPLPSIIRFPHTFPGYPIQMRMQLMLLLFQGQTFMLFLLLASFYESCEDCHRPCHRSLDHPPMDNQIVVSSSVEPTHPTPSADCSTQGSTSHSASTPHGPPTLQETLPSGSSFVREALWFRLTAYNCNPRHQGIMATWQQSAI